MIQEPTPRRLSGKSVEALQNPFPNISQLRGGNSEIYRNIFEGNKAHWGTVIIPTASSLQGHTPRPLMTGIPVIDAFAPWLLQFTNRHAGIVWELRFPILLFQPADQFCGHTGSVNLVWSVLPVPLVGGVYLFRPRSWSPWRIRLTSRVTVRPSHRWPWCSWPLSSCTSCGT